MPELKQKTQKKAEKIKKPVIIDAEAVSKKLYPKSPKTFILTHPLLVGEKESIYEKQEEKKKKEAQTRKQGALFSIFNRILSVLKIFKTPVEEKVPLLPEKSTITTIYDSIYAELKQKKIVKTDYLAKKYGMQKDKIIEIAMNFEETGKIEIIYPFLGSPRLLLKEKGELADETD
jgi:hypothetical protein